MNNENTVCHLRWGYPNISLSRNEIRTCCKTPFQKVSDELLDHYQTDIFLNTTYQKKRRMEMLQGIQHPDCKSCWSLEQSGATSLRGNNPYGFIDFAKRHDMFDEFDPPTLERISEEVSLDSKILESNNPFMLEVSLGNTCDMKCMYCNHVYSSQWASESLKNNTINMEIYKQVQTQPNERFINLFWNWVDTKAKHSLDRIGIIGGEPLITPIVLDSYFNRNMYGKLPVLILKDYDLNEKELLDGYDEIINKNQNIDIINKKYWENEIRTNR
jgi:hypothetical protein